MRSEFLDLLVCPVCTTGAALELTSRVLPIVTSRTYPVKVVEGTLSCDHCGTDFPIVGAVPILTRTFGDYLSAHKHEILSCLLGTDASADCLGLLHSARESIYGSTTRRESWETEQGRDLYVRSEFGEVQPSAGSRVQALVGELQSLNSFLTELSDEWRGDLVVDVGCNVGGALYHFAPRYARALGVDISYAAIRAAQIIFENGAVSSNGHSAIPPSHRVQPPRLDVERFAAISCDFVVGDAQHLPVKSSAADLTLLLNVLDISTNPALIVQECCRLTAQGGNLITASPYYWRPDRTSPSKWLESEDLGPEASLRNMIEGLGFSIEHESDAVPWILEMYDRYAQLWICHVLAATKAGPLEA